MPHLLLFEAMCRYDYPTLPLSPPTPLFPSELRQIVFFIAQDRKIYNF